MAFPTGALPDEQGGVVETVELVFRGLTALQAHYFLVCGRGGGRGGARARSGGAKLRRPAHPPHPPTHPPSGDGGQHDGGGD